MTRLRRTLLGLHRRFAHRVSPEQQERIDLVLARLDGPSKGSSGATADRFARGALSLRDFGELDISDGIPWSGWPGSSASEMRVLHALLVIHDLVATGRRDDVLLAHQHTMGWQRAGSNARMAWHDETTARRTLALVRLHAALSHDLTDAGRAERVYALLTHHVDCLRDPDFHATGTNHGMFQDRSLLLACAYLQARGGPSRPLQAGMALAERRLRNYFDERVSVEGVHLEHAPAYHQLAAANARRTAGLLRDLGFPSAAAQLEQVHAQMRTYATHVLQPDATWPLVSDTFRSDRVQTGLWDDTAYRYASRATADAAPPTETCVVFPESGYAVFRDRWSQDGRGTYVHFTAAYHGTYHKHADDLSLWLYHDGPLLTELGPAGYDYDRPEVICAYGELAHNTVTVVGRPLPRTDQRVGATRIVAYDLSDGRAMAEGCNDRLDGIKIRRRVDFDRSQSRLSVRDEVQCDEPYQIRIRWHLHPEIGCSHEGEHLVLTRDSAAVAHLTVTADTEHTIRLLGPDLKECSGYQFGGGEPTSATTIEVMTVPTEALVCQHVVDLRRSTDRATGGAH